MTESTSPYDRIAHRLAPHYARRSHEADIDRLAWYIPPGSRVLDAGCGVGRDVADMRARGFAAVGFDASPKMVSIARREFGGKFVVGDILWPPFAPESFDGIWAMSVLSLFDDLLKQKAIEALAELVRLDGLLFLAVWHGEGRYVTNEIAEDVPRTHFLVAPSRWIDMVSGAGFQLIQCLTEPVTQDRPPALKLWARKR